MLKELQDMVNKERNTNESLYQEVHIIIIIVRCGNYCVDIHYWTELYCTTLLISII